MSDAIRWLVCSVGFCCALFSGKCWALTTTYTFSSPDNVFVTVTPVGPNGPSWPAQLLNTRTAAEQVADIVFRNDVNNTVFLDSNALQVSNAAVLNGVFAWADVMYNGPTDEPVFEIDFTNWIGGTVTEVQFDFALTLPVPLLGVIAIDSLGTSQTLTAPVTSFTYGTGEQGAQGHATLTPVGSLQDIAKLQFEFADQNFNGLQFGFDNMMISNGQSADFGNNGSVDGNDLSTWQSAYGNSSAGDADMDGDSDGRDFLIWQREYTGTLPIVAASTSVPEPSTCLLFGMGTLALHLRRKLV